MLVLASFFMDSLITYERLYELLRLEKMHAEVQPLDVLFFSQVVHYVSEKQAILASQEKKESIFASAAVVKTRKQLEQVQKILRDLYERREHKVVQLALLSSRQGSALPGVAHLLKEERELYDYLVQIFDTFRKGVLENLLSCELPHVVYGGGSVSSSSVIVLVRFLHSVPAFVGVDESVYGPFCAEDVARLPKELTDVLVKRGRAVEI